MQVRPEFSNKGSAYDMAFTEDVGAGTDRVTMLSIAALFWFAVFAAALCLAVACEWVNG